MTHLMNVRWIASYQWQWPSLDSFMENQAFQTGRAGFSCSGVSNFLQLVAFGHLYPLPQTIHLFEFHSKWLEWLSSLGGSKCSSSFHLNHKRIATNSTAHLSQLKAPSVLPNKPQNAHFIAATKSTKVSHMHFTILLGCGNCIFWSAIKSVMLIDVTHSGTILLWQSMTSLEACLSSQDVDL